MSVDLDIAYQTQKARVVSTVTSLVGRLFLSGQPHAETVATAIPVVESAQSHMADLVAAYMSIKATEATGSDISPALDSSLYTIAGLRLGDQTAAEVYDRPFSVLLSTLRKNGGDLDAAMRSASALAEKLAATDLQLAQTHAARDWLTEAETATASSTVRVVGYRRVLSGPGPHCALCEAASTRTYRVSDLMPIHEHCTCTVQPLFGTEAVASVGTTVRVEEDPEIGPRLMAASWSPVGPRLTNFEEKND